MKFLLGLYRDELTKSDVNRIQNSVFKADLECKVIHRQLPRLVTGHVGERK